MHVDVVAVVVVADVCGWEGVRKKLLVRIKERRRTDGKTRKGLLKNL